MYVLGSLEAVVSAIAPDDDVIQEFDIEYFSCLLDLLGAGGIRPARGGIPGRMIVEYDNMIGICKESYLKDLWDRCGAGVYGAYPYDLDTDGVQSSVGRTDYHTFAVHVPDQVVCNVFQHSNGLFGGVSFSVWDLPFSYHFQMY